MSPIAVIINYPCRNSKVSTKQASRSNTSLAKVQEKRSTDKTDLYFYILVKTRDRLEFKNTF